MDNASTTEYTTVQQAPPTTVVKTTQVKPPVRTEHPQVVYEKKKAIFRTYQIIWYILGFIEIILAFRFALELMGANPASGFASFIYTISSPLVAPFQGIVPTSAASGSIFEWATIIAAIVYAIVAAGIVQLLQFFKPTNPQEVSEVVDNQ